VNNPCSEIERIVRGETLVGEHSKKLDTMDQKLDVIIDNLGGLKNSKSFIGGIAATGWLVGVLMVDIVKPFAKPIAAAMIAIIK